MYRKSAGEGPSPLPWLLAAWALFFLLATVPAQAGEGAVPRIAIIIDDLGDQWRAGSRAVDLPGPVTYAFLPHTRYAARLAERAHRQGKEVMLHLPMQAMAGKALGPGGLTLDMSRRQLLETLARDLAAIPHVVGINNHMGSLLTRHPGHMQWLMEAIRDRGDLFFLDSRTTHLTVAERLARENGVPVMRRDVFLDDDPAPGAVEGEFERLIAKARRQGYAIGIGHPYPATLELLERRLPRLASEEGVELVPVSRLVERGPALRMASSEEEEVPERLVYLAPETVPLP